MSRAPRSSRATATSAKERIIPIEVEAKAEAEKSHKQSKETVLSEASAKISEDINVPLLSDCSTASSPVTISQQSDSTTVDLDIPQNRPIPPTYMPEKIIIIMDRSLDDNFTFFEQKSNKKYNPLNMLQHAVQMFVNNKHALNLEHEFALMTLDENAATWTHNFTRLPQDIVSSLSSIKSCKPEDVFNMNSVFDLIFQHVDLPVVNDAATQFVVRAVLLYGRSYTIPLLDETPEIIRLLKSPVFTLDVIMTHEPPTSENNCNKIFETLQTIDPKGTSYSFSVSRNSKDLHTAFGKILGHPLQRPLQSNMNYDITKYRQ